MGAVQHPDSTWNLQRSMQTHQVKAGSQSLQTFQLIIPIVLVLRSKERWQVAAHSAQFGTAQPGHNQACQSYSIH